MANVRISDLIPGTAPFASTTKIELSVPNAGSPTGYDTRSATLSGLFTSPVFAGDPQAPTPTISDSDTSVATTGFVKAAIAASGAGQTFYYDPTDAADVATYKKLLLAPSSAAESTVPVSCSGTSDVLIGAFITDPGVPGAVDYPAGTAYRRLYGSVSAGTARFHLQVYVRTVAGVETLVRDEYSDNFTNTTVALQEWLASPSSGGNMATTDRIVNKIYAQRVAGPGTITVTFYAEGSSHASQIQTTISASASAPVSATPPLAISGGNISINLTDLVLPARLGLMGTTPSAPLHITATVTTGSNGIIQVNPQFSSNLSTQMGLYMAPTFQPTGAGLSTAYGVYSVPSVTGSVNLTNLIGLYTQPVLSSYTGTRPTTISGLEIVQPGGLTSSMYATTYRGIRLYGSGNGGGASTGIISNNSIDIAGHTAGAGSGSTVINRNINIVLSNGSGAGSTLNYGIYINGNGGSGGAGATTNAAIYSDSTAPSYLAGDLTIGGVLIQHPGASVTPALNGDLVMEATSNTSLTFKFKGSDGTVRSASLTLS